MNRILTMFLLVAAAVTWTTETMNRERLIKRLDQARLTVRPLARARSEHEDLLRRHPFVGEVEALRRDRAELMALRREQMHRLQPAEATEAALSAMGRELLPVMLWLPTTPMKNLGRATPHATLQTFFWAATTKDRQALKEVLTFDTDVRPGATRDAAEAEEAEWLATRTPFGDIQIMAERLKGFDEALEFLALRRPDGQVTAIPLRMRWEPGGWRVVVPGQVADGGTSNPAGNPFAGAPALPEP